MKSAMLSFMVLNQNTLLEFIKPRIEKELQTKEGVEKFLKRAIRFLENIKEEQDNFTVSFNGETYSIKKELIPEEYLSELKKKTEVEAE